MKILINPFFLWASQNTHHVSYIPVYVLSRRFSSIWKLAVVACVPATPNTSITNTSILRITMICHDVAEDVSFEIFPSLIVMSSCLTLPNCFYHALRVNQASLGKFIKFTRKQLLIKIVQFHPQCKRVIYQSF